MPDQAALLVIDMQKGSFIPETPRHDASNVITRINDLTALFRSKGFPVAFIQHDGTGTGEFAKGNEDWEVLDELSREEGDLQIDKYANDCFYRSKLNEALYHFDVKHLYFTGCATDFCVESTIQSALTKDYNITVVADGHTTGDRPHLSAKKIVEHYNYVWSNMIPTRSSIQVRPFVEITQQLI